jgi:UbiD family decarboxylase
VKKPVHIDDVGALSAQTDGPILFETIIEKPGFRLCDMLVKRRWSQCRALGVKPEEFLPTLAFRLRRPARGFVNVRTGPVKEVVFTGDKVDWTRLPVPYHSDKDDAPYITTMNIVKDPETGFYNSSNARTMCLAPTRGISSFVTTHTNIIIKKYLDMGKKEMPIAFVFGVHPAYEIMANFSGLHMDMWGEMEMVGTLMDQDVEMVPCETIDLTVPANAEITVEGSVNLKERFKEGQSSGPTLYYIPRYQDQPEVRITAITMRADRPIYRNHQSCPETDHQVLPRLCHEAVIFNRLTEMGLRVRDVRFPTWGAAVSCILQFEYPRDGFVNDALMLVMGSPWLNTKMVVAVSPDTDIDDPASVYHAIATRCDPSRDLIVVGNTRGSPYDPSAQPLEGKYPFRIVGKVGVDATVKSRHDSADFERAWPLNWGKVHLKDYV